MKIYCLFCFVFYLRFKECVLESNNKETIYLCFFHFVWGYDIQMKHTVFTCQIQWLTYLNALQVQYL